ncbi:MAG: hypothetical protein ABR968_10140, partial [Bacteroidales bacterium]
FYLPNYPPLGLNLFFLIFFFFLGGVVVAFRLAPTPTSSPFYPSIKHVIPIRRLAERNLNKLGYKIICA